MSNKRLLRSQNDRMIAGVAGGLAEYFDIDSTLVRLFFALICIFGGGVGFLLYFIMWIIMPEEKLA